MRHACASRSDFTHRHFPGCSPAGPGHSVVDYARVPELQSCLPALKERSANWLHWDGSRLVDPFDSGKLTSWSSGDEIANYVEHYCAANAVAEAAGVGNPRLYDTTLFTAAMHGRLDVYAEGKRLTRKLATGDLGPGPWTGTDKYASAMIFFSGLDVISNDRQYYADISTLVLLSRCDTKAMETKRLDLPARGVRRVHPALLLRRAGGGGRRVSEPDRAALREQPKSLHGGAVREGVRRGRGAARAALALRPQLVPFDALQRPPWRRRPSRPSAARRSSRPRRSP